MKDPDWNRARQALKAQHRYPPRPGTVEHLIRLLLVNGISEEKAVSYCAESLAQGKVRARINELIQFGAISENSR